MTRRRCTDTRHALCAMQIFEANKAAEYVYPLCVLNSNALTYGRLY